MADVSVSLGVTGKEVVTGAFQDVAGSAKAMGDALMEHTKKLAEAYLGYQSVVKVLDTFKQALEIGGKLNELSDQTGISAGKLALLQRAFENSGLQADELGKYVNKMQKFIESAGEAGSASADKLAKLGLTAADLKAMSPDEQFAALAHAVAGISDPAEKASLSMDLFGKSGGKLLNLFDGFDQTMAQARQEIGGLADIMDAKASSFDTVSDSLKAIGNKAVEFAVGLLDQALPALETLTEYLKSFDATKFGQQFSETLVKGIDFVLGIFRNPGDTFLAFGDALTVALKTGVNYLMDGLKYVFDWSTNYVSEIIPNYADILKSEFNVAVGAVVGFFGGQLSKVLSDLAVLIPGQLGDAMGKAAEKLATFSKDATDLAQQGLADAWEKVGNAAANATEQTHLQSQDWTDVAGSAQQMRDHAEAVRSSGEAFRNQMAEANNSSEEMAKNVALLDEAGKNFSDHIFGAAKSFQDFMNQGAGSNGPTFRDGVGGAGAGSVPFKPQSGPINTGGAATSAAAAVRSTGAAPAGPSIPSSFLGSNPYDQSVKSAQASGDYLNYLSAKQSQDAYNSARMEELNYQAGQARAAQDYTGNSQTSFADLFAQVQEKYRNMGYNRADSAALTDKELQDYITKNPGPSAKDGGGGAGGGAAGPQKSPEATLMDKIYALLEKHVPKIDDKLPLMALS